MDLVVNEEFTKMYSDEELMGARRIQASLNTNYCGAPAVSCARERADFRSALFFVAVSATCRKQYWHRYVLDPLAVVFYRLLQHQ